MTKQQYIHQLSQISEKNIQSTLQLLSEDCTIPFIARYRKDKTGNLDEVQIEQIAKLSKNFDEIIKRKESILASIEEQNALTPELQSKIESSFVLQDLEDLYLPYKKKRKTKADTARENGLEPLAKIIMSQNSNDVEASAQRFVKNNVNSVEVALQGARDIIAEWINENIFVRNKIRRLFQKTANITSKVVKAKAEEETSKKFEQYFDWSEPISRIPSHRLLAILRAEAEGIVKFKIDADTDEALLISRFSKNSRR